MSMNKTRAFLPFGHLLTLRGVCLRYPKFSPEPLRVVDKTYKAKQTRPVIRDTD